MCKIYTYPTSQDIKVVKTAMQVFLKSRNAAARNIMLGACRAMLDRYGITRISFSDYIVEKGEYNNVRIIPREYTEGQICPCCGSSLYGDLSTIITVVEGESGDIVTYGCGCGTITGKWELV